MEIGSFKISGHSTKRNWAVYLFVATPKEQTEKTILYVGKVGDNRDGCNPVISRVGNHFSFNKIHSQIRNEIKETENYDYEYFYCHFGEYENDENKHLRINSRKKTDELERELNRIVQKKLNAEKHELIKPFSGKTISTEKTKRRAELITDEERMMLKKLCAQAL
ncbi:hypothetical protein H9I45_01325 [Polaribacter haliotis]|uniref:GIY-YIG domain-containing protein n=1 Tax=Polaribacter haliotis TaxID=1888915 RepID=A0A7L8AGH5_9FLAO|nr:hypothetical protein [Polaribacter haliotis]QOD61111.1 hypothetical protein H9I45_01325 [Polaribacter haliotis]